MSPAMTPFVVEFLGSGTSTGVPVIGCDCPVCRSPDPRDKRLRPSILILGPQGNVLIDTTPDMRTQMLRAGIDRVDAVLLTHTHADHLFGMDDIRQFNFRSQAPMPVHGTAATLEHVRRVFDYCFKETQAGGGKPQLQLEEICPYEPFLAAGRTITPLVHLHGELPVLGFVVDRRLAYVTDVSAIPERTLTHLRGLDTLVLGTVRFEPHPTHFCLEEALDVVAQLAPRRAYFTHLSHHFGHAAVSATLPPGVALAHDGLRFSV